MSGANTRSCANCRRTFVHPENVFCSAPCGAAWLLAGKRPAPVQKAPADDISDLFKDLFGGLQ